MQILDYYPPVVKQVKEIQQIAKAEDREFSKLAAASGSVLNNMFISTADENGIARFEKLLGIETDTSRTLEERKMCAISMMNKCKLTLLELAFMLSGYAGDISVSCDYEKYELFVNSGENVTGTGVIYSILDGVLPLQVYIIFAMGFETVTEFTEISKKLEMETTARWWRGTWHLDGSVKLDGSRRLDAVLWKQTAALEMETIQETKEFFGTGGLSYGTAALLEIKEKHTDAVFETGTRCCQPGTDVTVSAHRTGMVFETTVNNTEVFTGIILTSERDLWHLDGSVKLDGSRKLDARKTEEVL